MLWFLNQLKQVYNVWLFVFFLCISMDLFWLDIKQSKCTLLSNYVKKLMNNSRTFLFSILHGITEESLQLICNTIKLANGLA